MLFYTLLILIPVLIFALGKGTLILWKNWRITNLLQEGKIDEALNLISSGKKKEMLARRCLSEGQIAQGLQIYERNYNHNLIQTYIYDELPIPKKLEEYKEYGIIFTKTKIRRSSLADLVYNAATGLLALKQNVNSLNNPYIPENLKSNIRFGLEDGFFILWDICHRLSLIETQKLPIEEHNLKNVRNDMQKLIELSQEANKELAQLTLERDTSRMTFYQDTFQRFCEEAREIRNARRLLSE